MVLLLAERLEVPVRERNHLLLAAGHAPAIPEHSISGPELAPVREALDLILAAQEPYPAVVVDRGWNLVAANSAMASLAAWVDPVLLQPPRARDLEGIEILPATMANQLALLGLGDVLIRAGASLAQGVDVRWGRGDDGLHRYRTLHIDRLALRREAVAEAAARGAEIRCVAHLPALSATRGEWVDCAGQRFFAALDATGRLAAWARPVERLGRTYADIFAVATPAFSRLARVLRLSGGWAYAAGSAPEATVGVIRDKPCREVSLPDEIQVCHEVLTGLIPVLALF